MNDTHEKQATDQGTLSGNSDNPQGSLLAIWLLGLFALLLLALFSLFCIYCKCQCE